MKRWVRLLVLLLAWGISLSPGFVSAEQPPLRVSSEVGFPPYVDVDVQGQSTGFAIELLSAVAAVMDIPVIFLHPDKWDIVWQDLKTGKIDVLPLVAHLPEHEGQVEFTEPHTIGYDSFFVRQGSPALHSIEQVRTMDIIVLRSDAANEALASRGLTSRLVPVDSLADGFRLLASGHHDAVLAPVLPGNAVLENMGLNKIVTSGPLIEEYRREFCFAVPKGNVELRDRLDQGLAIVKANGEYDRLYRKWLGFYEVPTFPVKYVIWGTVAAVGLFALMGLWNWQLRRQVALRTAELDRVYTTVHNERQLLYDVLQALPVYVVLLSQDYKVTFANRFFEQRYGKAHGQPCYQYLFNRDKPCEVCETFKVLKTNGPISWDWTGPDNYDYEIHDFPFKDTDGSPMIMEVGIDVTEMNRAKHALREANALLEQRVKERTAELEVARHEAELAHDLLRVTMDNAPALMSYIDKDCRYLRINRNYERWFGHSEEQIRGCHMREILGEAAWQSIEPYVRQVLAGEQIDFDLELQYIEGGPRWIHATYSPDFDAEGQVRGFVVHVLDISERKKAKDGLIKAHALLDGLLTQAPVGFTYLDRELRYLIINERLAEINGVPATEHIGRRVYEIVPMLAPAVEEIVERILMTGEPVKNQELSGEVPTFPGMTRYWNESWYPLYDDAEIIGFGVIVEDITERKQAEKALREADRRKDEFLAMLAHELRNPLAPISNAVHIMKLSSLDETRLAWCSDVIGRQVEHLVRLVDDLLDVSRISRGKIELKKESLDVSIIVQRAVETSQPLIDARRHEFSVSLPPEPVYVEGDLVRLSQVVSNLLNNAAKYTDKGGCIRLIVEIMDNNIFIRVRDNGRGIDASSLFGLFDLFYQVDRTIDRAEGGLGIGLALVKSLVAMHGGEVWAQSEGRGKGSEFVIRLPCLSHLPSAQASCRIDSKSSENSLSILVVDDNRDAAQSLSLLLSSEGHTVWLAYDGHEALQAALTERPDVVLLDIGLPGMDGYAVAQSIRQHPEMKMTHLIALSGYGRREDREQAKEVGFNGYLTKPVNFSELHDALAAVLIFRQDAWLSQVSIIDEYVGS